MTNGELFIAENPNIEFKINGSCVWIYFDGVNHYTMPTLWWEQEISLFNKIRAEIEEKYEKYKYLFDTDFMGTKDLEWVLSVIDKYRNEVANEMP